MSADPSQSPEDRKRSFEEDEVNQPGAADGPNKRQALDEESKVEGDQPADEPIGDAQPAGDVQPAEASAHDEEQPNISMRALIANNDAGLIIGKAGRTVADIRERSGAKVNVSENHPGVTERILTVSGPLDAVASAFSLVAQQVAMGLISEDQRAGVATATDPKQRTVAIRLLIPHPRMGGIIGKGGARIREIQEQSAARISASEEILPGSTERLVTVTGLADSIHIATYHIGQSAGDHPPVMPYRPGQGGHGGGSHHHGSSSSSRSSRPPPPSASSSSGSSQSVQIYVPAELIGSVIGKAGRTINGIRSQSGAKITIAEGTGERSVTIQGNEEQSRIALYLLYQAMENAKQQQAAAAAAATGQPVP